MDMQTARNRIRLAFQPSLEPTFIRHAALCVDCLSDNHRAALRVLLRLRQALRISRIPNYLTSPSPICCSCDAFYASRVEKRDKTRT